VAAIGIALLVPCLYGAQERKTPVSVFRIGQDQVGSLFVAAVNRELAKSVRNEQMPSEGIKDGFRFYVELISIDVSDDVSAQGKRSVISVVIEEMGLPNSIPVSNMWYHKVVVVD
jgi:hypothetical protein